MIQMSDPDEMFSNKILIVVGDSFVYGHLGDDIDHESCHRRSWVNKLGQLGNFKSTINLGSPGGSNTRSYRVLLDYLNDHYDENSQYLIIYAVTGLDRFELPVIQHDGIKHGIFSRIFCPHEKNLESRHFQYNMSTIGTWVVDSLAQSNNKNLLKIADFLKIYYGMFVHNVYSEKILEHQLFSLKAIFDKLKVKYYFTETIPELGIVKKFKFLNETLPTIDYLVNNQPVIMKELITSNGFEIAPCTHFTDQGHEFLAKYIYNYILADKEKTNGI